MAISQKFKSYQVITANSSEEIGLRVTPMVAEGGWQLYGPIMLAAKPDGTIHYAQALMLFEYINTPDEEAQTQ